MRFVFVNAPIKQKKTNGQKRIFIKKALKVTLLTNANYDDYSIITCQIIEYLLRVRYTHITRKIISFEIYNSH